jgi:hypothetical protein
MQTESNITSTYITGSADVSCGPANTVYSSNTDQVAPIDNNTNTQQTEPKKRGRKKGYHHSEETKAAMRKARIGVYPSKETKDKISKSKFGKNHSVTAKLKMSDTRRYNFLRKAIKSAIDGKSSLSTLIKFFNDKIAQQDSMSDFAKTIYSIAYGAINELPKNNADSDVQYSVYIQLEKKIKELYDVRIKELSREI